ncbi:membrane protein [Sulfurifustis variabilis]|uniref:Translocation and assembly module subunit TamA n=1 Tax=Sulfurifustis variabilis TaxID=1675686 RepID=A0A1B4V370_9GAMM|nr:autotransporter assembly complex family protein [Sulfurifustis variabilis]BAU48000.1 membrane protein [Sulfurifustis variabilis]
MRAASLACLLGLLLGALPVLAASPAIAVEVEGVGGELRDNVLAFLGIYQSRAREDLSPVRVRRLHTQAEGEIRRALQPFGFYRPRIESQLTRTAEGWLARYVVAPGEPVRVRELDLRIAGEGAEDPEFRRILDAFPLTKGERLRHADYEAVKRELQKVAAERGYFDFRIVQSEVRVDVEKNAASVHLHIDTGARYRFGEITLDQDLLDPAFLRRYLRIKPGQPYSTRALLELQTALADSDYFADIDVLADPAQAVDHAIPVRIRLTPRKQDRYTFGIGYGTDTGARGRLGWQRRYINERGHHLRAELRASGIQENYTVGYFIPFRNPRTDQYAITAGYEDDDTLVYESQITRVGVSRTAARGRTRETLSLTYQSEDFDVGDQTGATALVMPGANWVRTWGEERVYTPRGARLWFELRGGSAELGSDISFLQARLQPKLIYSIWDSGRFIARAEVGSTRIDDFDELPASLRFFAGGDQSVRGYRYNSLGPEDASGDVIGARKLLVASLEYEHRIRGGWSAAVFYDAGNALEDYTDALARGAGFGVRWRSPIGQVRVDLASALSEDGNPWRLHLTIGPDL